MKKRILSLLMALVMMWSLVPTNVLAVNESGAIEKRLTGITVYVNDEYDRGTVISYNFRGRVESIEFDYADESYNDSIVTFNYTYLNQGGVPGMFLSEQIETSDYEVLTKRYTYDDQGSLTRISSRSNWDDSNSYSFRYNENNQLVRMWDSHVSSEYFYDDSGMMTKEVRKNSWDPYGSIITYEYDSINRLTKTISVTTFDGEAGDEFIETNYSYEYSPLTMKDDGSIFYDFQDAAPIGFSIPVLSYVGYNERVNVLYGKVDSVIRDEDGYVSDIYGYELGSGDDAIHCELIWDKVKPYDGPTSGQYNENIYWAFDEITGALTFTGEGIIKGPSDANQMPPWYEFNHLIKTVVINKGITGIGSLAFSECFMIESVIIPDGVTYIGFGSFWGCDNLKKVTLPNSVTRIGMYAFISCVSLSEVTIPSNLTKIEMGAFQGVYNLRIVNYTGTETQWNQIEIEEDNDYFTRLTPVYNYKGEDNEELRNYRLVLSANSEPLTVTTGETAEIVCSLYDGDTLVTDWDAPHIAFDNVDCIEYGDWEKCDAGYKMAVKGLKAGTATFTVEDPNTNTKNQKLIEVIEDEDFFVVGRDTNTFNHFEENYVIKTEGNVVPYITSSYYYEKLTEGKTPAEITELNKWIYSDGTWDGTCFGTALTMYWNNIGASDFSVFSDDNHQVKNYCDMPTPAESIDFRDYINYAHMLQNTDKVKLKTVWSNKVMNAFHAVSWTSFWNDFEKVVASNVENQKPTILSYFYLKSNNIKSGHTVLVCGYEKKDNEVVYRIYDNNSYSWSDFELGFIELHVNPNKSGEFYWEQNGKECPFPNVRSNNWVNFKLCNVDATDAAIETNKKLDWADYANTAQLEDTLKLSVNGNSPFYVSKADGTYLSYDGTKYDGDMVLYDVNLYGEENCKLEFTTSKTESFSITSGMDTNTFSVTGNECYFEVGNTTADKVIISVDQGVSFEGDEFEFSVGGNLPGQVEFVEVAGKSTENVNMFSDGENFVVETDGEVMDASLSVLTKDGVERKEIDDVFSRAHVDAMGEVGDVHKHTIEKLERVEATCETNGLTEGEICSDCGEILKEQEVISALGHKETKLDGEEATCTESGLTDGTKCSVCDAVIEKQEMIPAKGHSFSEGMCEVCESKDPNYVAPTMAPTPTVKPTVEPTAAPTPTVKPTVEPTAAPTPTVKPTVEPTAAPTPTVKPTVEPTAAPTPTVKPTVEPTAAPTPTVKPTVTPTPTPVIDNPFKDVKESDWFFTPVMWAKANEVTGGTSATTFGPNDSCTRAQVVTFLWAANGKPEPKLALNPFDDVKESDWYYKPVLWAVENGITGGVSKNLFGPNQTCTRAQIVTFLYAAVDKPAVIGNSDFKDVADTDWFAKPVIWAAQNEVTGGIGDGKFGPNNTCTRGQVVTFLYKVYGVTAQ